MAKKEEKERPSLPEPETSRPSGRNVVYLMDALKKSVTGRNSAEEPPAKKRRWKKAG
jgi:non-homologous end joining protein Ku